MTKKRFISLTAVILCLSMLISVPMLVSSVDLSITQEEAEDVCAGNAASYAVSFVEVVCEENNYESGNVVSFRNEDDALSGYCVDILVDGESYGYVIIKFANDEAVVSEYCIAEGAKNPYDAIIDRNLNISSADVVLYSVGQNEYQVYSEQDKTVYCYDTASMSVSEFEEYKTDVAEYNELLSASVQTVSDDDDDSEYLVYSSFSASTVITDIYSGTLKSSATVSRAGEILYYSDDDIDIYEDLLGTYTNYNCAVIAMCNMMKYYKYIGYSKIGAFYEIYPELWDLAGTHLDEYGRWATTTTKVAPAVKSYLKSLGYTCSYDNYWLDLYSDFTRDVDDDLLCYLAYHGTNSSDTEWGHGVLVIGYAKTSSYNYLKICDGWNSYPRYFNFNGYDYDSLDGWSFTVSK